ncbi:class I SAM-dependent methyltransferase [Staphylospora marina]|uniref:class I SAM-dependent methyltransferase n=1 Tax=Staphylospora marina TaxID=2490858 RepID=UPI000F5BBD59|nr:class I SAM-dependent methyltransferase [Staphylospora marina]
MILPSILESARHWVRQALSPGGIAVDGTCGNGHDTLFLAERAGPDGMVYGFDIQQEALSKTRERLHAHGMTERVQLFHAGHERMHELLPSELRGRIDAFMFNLGYLPKGDTRVVTRPETTLAALETATEWLTPGGIISVCLYTGHPGGREEADAVLHFASHLPPGAFQVMHQQLPNRREAPSLLVLEKRNRPRSSSRD